MPLSIDPELAQLLGTLSKVMESPPKLPVGDAVSRRALHHKSIAALSTLRPKLNTEISKDVHYARANDGHLIAIHRFQSQDVSLSANASANPAILFMHGGGFISGTVDLLQRTVQDLVAATGVTVFSVEYRLAPEYPHPVPLLDCYTALLWLHEHKKDLKIDDSRIAVMGESAGGGLAAGVALLARDNKLHPTLKKQILVYPMLDDRTTTPDPNIAPYASWTYEDNATAWEAYLNERPGGDPTSPIAAPARAVALEGMPDTYIEVGMLDIFRDEDVLFASRLMQSGVNVELHILLGLVHAFDALAPEIKATKRALALRAEAVKDV